MSENNCTESEVGAIVDTLRKTCVLD